MSDEVPISWTLYAANFVIIETSVWLPEAEGVVNITGDLESLLASTVAYPPARALACRGLEDSDLSWPEFAQQLEEGLRNYIESQATSGFRLLRCLKDQGASLDMGGYGGVGRYYWALAANEETVDWVSDHTYEVFWSHIGEFEVPAGCVLSPELPGPLSADSKRGSLLAQAPDCANPSVRGGEYAWSISAWRAVLAQAESLGMACLGGTFQFRTPLHTIEMYRLRMETSDRSAGEPWADYCQRTRAEMIGQVDGILKATDFEAEAHKFRTLSDYLRKNGRTGMEFLAFCPTLESESP
ncbi:MAG: hypothetical protein KIS61_16720 [Candidatus Eremiobacteraeota bacterium]|nr:hypothetical protein [Candidatus Eremiobacteraeota bacterium]